MPKKEGTKYKSLLVARYLMQYCDEDHPVWAKDILDYLEKECGIVADRRSLYNDIEALRSELDMIIDEEKVGRDYKYTFGSRPLDFEELRILAECAYSAKFISQSKAKEIVADIASLGTEDQLEFLLQETFCEDRVRTTQKGTLNIIAEIKRSLTKQLVNGKPMYCKISFLYLKHNLDDLGKQVTRRKGERYIVSPFKLIIYDGYYYLLSFDDKYKEMRTYRVDRMKDVRMLEEPAEGRDEFCKIDTKTLTKRVFGMYGGEKKHVALRFVNPLLDTVIDRFGTDSDASYCKEGSGHFIVRTDVEVSDQFYGWLLGFGNKVKIMYPDDVINDFKAYLDKVRGMYEPKPDKKL